MEYMFINKPEFAEPIRVIFLCGIKFKDNETDKRIVLKNYLENDSKNKVLILEKYFDFAFKSIKVCCPTALRDFFAQVLTKHLKNLYIYNIIS